MYETTKYELKRRKYSTSNFLKFKVYHFNLSNTDNTVFISLNISCMGKHVTCNHYQQVSTAKMKLRWNSPQTLQLAHYNNN